LWHDPDYTSLRWRDRVVEDIKSLTDRGLTVAQAFSETQHNFLKDYCDLPVGAVNLATSLVFWQYALPDAYTPYPLQHPVLRRVHELVPGLGIGSPGTYVLYKDPMWIRNRAALHKDISDSKGNQIGICVGCVNPNMVVLVNAKEGSIGATGVVAISLVDSGEFGRSPCRRCGISATGHIRGVNQFIMMASTIKTLTVIVKASGAGFFGSCMDVSFPGNTADIFDLPHERGHYAEEKLGDTIRRSQIGCMSATYHIDAATARKQVRVIKKKFTPVFLNAIADVLPRAKPKSATKKTQSKKRIFVNLTGDGSEEKLLRQDDSDDSQRFDSKHPASLPPRRLLPPLTESSSDSAESSSDSEESSSSDDSDTEVFVDVSSDDDDSDTKMPVDEPSMDDGSDTKMFVDEPSMDEPATVIQPYERPRKRLKRAACSKLYARSMPNRTHTSMPNRTHTSMPNRTHT